MQNSQYLHRHMPLTQAMNVTAESYDGHSLALAAPLTPNINNSETAFGGSIATLAITAGWMLLRLLLEKHGVAHRLVIQKSTVSFQRPIDADFRAVTQRLSTEQATAFVEEVRGRRNAKITIATKVYCQDMVAATHEGIYVALTY